MFQALHTLVGIDQNSGKSLEDKDKVVSQNIGCTGRR